MGSGSGFKFRVIEVCESGGLRGFSPPCKQNPVSFDFHKHPLSSAKSCPGTLDRATEPLKPPAA